MKAQTPSPERGAAATQQRGLFDLSTCYAGSMLGITLATARLRAYAGHYPVLRQRMQACLDDWGSALVLPRRRNQFVDKHQSLLKTLVSECGKVSPACIAWMLFGNSVVEYAIRQAFRSPGARHFHVQVAFVLDRIGIPRTALAALRRRCQAEKSGRKDKLSLDRVHSAALGLLNEVIRCFKRDPDTAFVAMPFSSPRMAAYYGELYVPILQNLELTPLRAWGGFGLEDYQDLLYTLIDRCGVMLADISTLNPNVMHEVGYAIGLENKFVILLAEEGQKVPANLGDLTVLRYQHGGRRWQEYEGAKLTAIVAVYLEAAKVSSRGSRPRRTVGPMRIREP